MGGCSTSHAAAPLFALLAMSKNIDSQTAVCMTPCHAVFAGDFSSKRVCLTRSGPASGHQAWLMHNLSHLWPMVLSGPRVICAERQSTFRVSSCHMLWVGTHHDHTCTVRSTVIDCLRSKCISTSFPDSQALLDRVGYGSCLHKV